MSFIQSVVYGLEVGRGRVFIRLIPMLVGFGFLLVFYDFSIYRGPNDSQSMDNAQLARRISRGEGFTTEFLRPYALSQLHTHQLTTELLSGGSGDLFPASRFPRGTPRVVPDTYNAPGYPCVLAAWFKLVRPDFSQTFEDVIKKRQYSGDRWIPELNQIFVFLTMFLVLFMGYRLFDDRVAWMSAVAFLLSDTVWQYSVTGLSTCFLMFLVTATLACAVEISGICEKLDEEAFVKGSLAPAWTWVLLLGLFLAVACLTRLQLLILLVPVLLFFIVLPRSHNSFFPIIAILVVVPAACWFWHTYRVCGNPLGSNMPLLLYGEDGSYKNNQIYCSTAIPDYESLFKDSAKKECNGFLWHLEHIWSLLGSCPMIVLAMAAILHRFKRQRVRAFQWLVIGSVVCLVAANNLCTSRPEEVSAWNVAILLLPALLVIGSAFFFVMLERLELHLELARTLIVVAALVLTGLPICKTLATPNYYVYNYPPYVPPFIQYFGQLAKQDEWVTTDMPWATAWYADRASLWLPDTIADFENFHDSMCPTGMLILTPVTLDLSMVDLRAGEFKDWYDLLLLNNMTPRFPLQAHVIFNPGRPGSDYSMWSDIPRWPTKNK